LRRLEPLRPAGRMFCHFSEIEAVRSSSLKGAMSASAGRTIVSELRIAIVGFGKIARTQHVPAIAATQGAT